nr:uncharacterized protein LOC124212296 [Neodiprion pinetum]
MTAKRPEKFLQLTKIILHGFKVFGLAPFSVQAKNLFANFGKPVCIWAFSFSKIGLVYNLLLAILIPIAYVLLVPKFVAIDYEHKTKQSSFCDVAWSIVAISTVWVVIVSWTFKQSNAVIIMNRLIDVDFRLSLTNGPNIRVPPSVLISLFITEYFFIVGLLEAEFYRVNNMLLKCKDFHYLSSAIPFLSSGSEISDLSNHNQLSALRSLRRIRTMLFEITNDVANFFSFPILMCVCYCFVTLVYCAYWIIIGPFGSNKAFSLDFALRELFILIILYPVTLLVNKVTKTIEEARRIGLVVHKLVATTTIPEMKKELTEFSLRILHEEFNFTAYGFFQLDFTLLHSMLATSSLKNYITLLAVSDLPFMVARVAKEIFLTFVIAYPVILLVYNVPKTVNEAKRTGLVIHKLMDATAIPVIKAELTEFSLRILHEELNFTAYGFFRLDFTLLHSMLAALVTYLVILVQYSG